MALPKDIPTLEAFNTKNLTHVDQVFLSEEITEQVILCTTVPALRPPQVDYFPIITKLMSSTQAFPPTAEFESVEEFELGLDTFSDIVSRTIVDRVPLIWLSPHTKQWWNSELADLNCHEEAQVAACHYASKVDEAKDKTWLNYLESLTDSTIWEASGLVMHWVQSYMGSDRDPSTQKTWEDGLFLSIIMETNSPL
ncbi:hypothetical protein BDQ17DRAFT_1435971 [Cyathus striatus]|nr:hypothetical protein BDQ17DRAFT_1435971 [Cyathus striatus]